MSGGPSRICIITAAQIGSNPRVVKEAHALHDAGFEVTVIALRTLDSVEPRDQSVLRVAPWHCQRIDLRSRWRRSPTRLLQLGSRAVATWLRWPLLADLSVSPFTSCLSAAAAKIHADLYIAHYPAALAAAAYAAKRNHARFAFDAEDFHPGELPLEPRYDQQCRFIQAVERHYLSQCAYVTAASPGIADAYAQAYAIATPQAILNTFPLAQAPECATPRGRAVPGPSLYWFSQTIGPDRGLECAVRAIGLARSCPHLYLRGSPAEGFIEKLQSIAREVGAADRLHLLEPEAPYMMERLAAEYDVGLVAETETTLNHRLALANKLFSFLLAGVPPLLSDTAAHRAFALEAGLEDHLFPIDCALALAARLDAFLGDPACLSRARAHAYRLGRERYHWEVDAAALLSTVREGLGASREEDEANVRPLSILRPA